MIGLKLVLPQWKFDFSDYISGTLFPFEYVMDFDRVRLQQQLGISTAEKLPNEFVNECFAQLHYTHGRASYGVASTTTYMSLEAALLIAKKRGILCLDADMSFYHLPKWNEKLRDALKKPISLQGKRKFYREFWKQFHPSERYIKATQLIVSRAEGLYKKYLSNQQIEMPIFGDKSSGDVGAFKYVSIHARLEQDMQDFCRSNRIKNTFHFRCANGVQFVCESTSDQIQERLIQDNIPENTPLFIVSGLSTVTDALIGLCKVMLDYDEKVQAHSVSDKGKFICIRKESVWKATETPDIANIFNSLAFLDFIIAAKSIAFYGHRYSSFSQHLVHHELHSKNISAQYYNQKISC